MNPSFVDLYSLWLEDEYFGFTQYAVAGKEDWRGLVTIRCSTCKDDLPIIINNKTKYVRAGGREWMWADPAFTFDSFRPFIELHLWHHGWKSGLSRPKDDLERKFDSDRYWET